MSFVRVIFSVVLFIRVSFSSGFVLTEKDFKIFKCSSICTIPALEEQLKHICVQLRKVVQIPECWKIYDDETVGNKAKCLKKRGINLQNEKGKIKKFKRTMGMCEFNGIHARCVTIGIKQNTIYHYDYNKAENLCSDPTEMNYSIPLVEEEIGAKAGEEEKGGWREWFAFFHRFKFW